MLSVSSAPLAATPSGRLSYARIAEVRDGVSVDKFEVPNLIELRLESFQWFIEKGLRDLFDFLANDLDIRMAFYPFRDEAREEFAVDSQRAARRQGGSFGAFKQQRAKHPQFVFEHAGSAVRQVGTERIRTNEFGQSVGLMRSRLHGRAHFIEPNLESALGSLVGGLAPSQTAADHE